MNKNNQEDSITQYLVLREKVDGWSERITSRYQTHIQCRAGCDSCCHHPLSVFGVEAEVVRQALSQLPDSLLENLLIPKQETIDPEFFESCPLLNQGTCSIYAHRPLICRTQGLPLLYEAEDGVQEVDFCPLNFTQPGAVEELVEEYLIPLDSVNEELARINMIYCVEKGMVDSGLRVPLRQLLQECAARRKA
jgi:uncharacterized protein